MARLITFGGLSARNGAVINGVANPRSRLAILAVLAVAGERGLRRERLAAMFWPDSDEERARNALRQALFTLKRDIGGGDITLGVSDLRLNPEVLTADVTDFDVAMREQRFADAASLYRGAFLDGVYLKESPDFERWTEEHRARLSSDYGRALERAAAEAHQQRDFRSAADWWEQRARHDPLSGRVARLYMEALVAAGDREQAIRHASQHVDLVRRELEVEPDAEVLALAETLKEAPKVAQRAGAATAVQEPLLFSDPVHPMAERPRADLPLTGNGRRGVRVAVIIAGLTVLGLTSRSLLTTGPAIQPGLVAIDDFDNRTGDSSLNAVTRLASSRLIEVISLSGHGGSIDLRQTSGAHESQDPRKTPAEFLLRGTLERRGRDSLAMIAQIVRARSGATSLPLEPITVPLSERDRLVDEVRERAGGAVVALGDTAFPLWRSGRSRPPRYSAYHEFRQGIDALVQQGMEEAVRHFLKAMELDTSFAQAKLWYLEQASGLESERHRVDSVLSVVRTQRGGYVPYDQLALDRQVAFLEGRLEDMYTAARQMVAMAPDAPDVKMLMAHAAYATRRYHEAIEQYHGVHAAPAWVSGLHLRHRGDLWAHRLLGDLDVAIAEWRQVVAQNPDAVDLCELGIGLFAAAGRESSVDSVITACEQLPASRRDTDRTLVMAGGNFRMRGHDAAAQRVFRRALSIRTRLAAEGARPKGSVAMIHADLGEWQAAYDILRPIASPNAFQRVMLGVAAAHVGDTATARAVIRWTDTQSKRDGAEMDRAFIEAALGERDQAIASLRAAVRSGVVPGFANWYVRPELLPLRGDPRFEDLIRPRR